MADKNKTNSSNLINASAAGASVLSIVLSAGTALSAPVGGNIVGGQGSIDQSRVGETHINQDTNRLAIDWQSFDINQNELVQFNQPGVNSIALNRVVGSLDPSRIMGTLRANGQVVLINPNGLYFGKDSVVDVAGLVGTTANITNENFMNGNMKFDQAGNPNAQIINDGTINVGGGTAKENGLAALISPRVENNGVIAAKLGKVQLAAGDTFVLDTFGDGLINLAVAADVTKERNIVDSEGNKVAAGVSNTGEINADGGTVYMTAKTASDVLDNVINLEGKVSANSIQEKNGEIILGAGEGAVNVAGTIEAKGDDAGEKGGNVQVTGNQVNIESTAEIDVSGNAGGGEALIGGDYQGKNENIQNAKNTVIERGAEINADATENGDGGRVIVWADETTRYQGSISAQGGSESGNGGFVEVSGKQNLGFNGEVNLSANAEGYDNGSLLLDPENVTFSDTGTNDSEIADGIVNEADGGSGDFVISYSALQAALNSAAVTVTAGTEISFSGDTSTTKQLIFNGLTVTAPTVSILVDIFAPFGLQLNATTLNLDGKMFDLASSTGVTTVNVLSNRASINEAIGLVSENGTVNLADGNYGQTVLINKNITLAGESREGTVIYPEDRNNSFRTSFYEDLLVNSAIMIQNADNVTIKNLTINGEDLNLSDNFEPEQIQLAVESESETYNFDAAIGFDNAGGTVDNVETKGFVEFESPIERAVVGIFADVDNADEDTQKSVTVQNSTISGYNAAGVVLNGDLISGKVDNNTIKPFAELDSDFSLELTDIDSNYGILGLEDIFGGAGVVAIDAAETLADINELLDSEDIPSGITESVNGIPVNLASTTEVASVETPTSNEVSNLEEVNTYNIEITNNTIENNLLGIGVLNTNDVLVSGNTVRDSLAGVVAYDTDNLDITNNNFYGPYFELSAGLLSLNNTNLNATDNFFDGYAYGIMSIGGTDNIFNLNEIDDSYYVGIGLLGETNVTVTNNDIYGYNYETAGRPSYFYGIQASSVSGSTITGNEIYDMDAGIELSGESTGTNAISNNLIDGSYTGINIVTNSPEILEDDSEVSDIQEVSDLEVENLPQITVSGNNIYAYGESQTQDRQSIGINIEEAYGDIALSDNYIEYSFNNSFYDGCYMQSQLCLTPDTLLLETREFSDTRYQQNIGPDIGIRIVGADNVTSTNDEIVNFALGIYADNANGLLVDDAYIYETSDFMDYYGGYTKVKSANVEFVGVVEDSENDYSLDREFAYGDTFGIALVSSDNATVENSEVANYDYGIYSKQSNNIAIDNNTVHAKEVFAPVREIENPSEDNPTDNIQLAVEQDVLENEEFEYSKHSGNYGIYIIDSNSATISNNTVSDNFSGIGSFDGLNNVISDNTISDNSQFSIFAGGLQNYAITGNTTTSSNYGIFVNQNFFSNPLGFGEFDGVISGNTITANNFGIDVFSPNVSADITNNNVFINLSNNNSNLDKVAFEFPRKGISIRDGADGSIIGNNVAFIGEGEIANPNSALIYLSNADENIAIDNNILVGGDNFGIGVEILGTQGVTMSGNNILGGLTGLKLSNGESSEGTLGIARVNSLESSELASISADVEFTGANNFAANETYIALDEGIMVGETLDASGSIFDGVQGSNMTEAQIVAAEDKAIDVEDFLAEDTRGDVFFGEGTGTGAAILNSAVNQTNQQENTDFRNLFSYAGNTIGVNPLDGSTYFNSLGLNLSLLSSSGVSGAVDFANLAPAAGGTGDASSCLNSFLSAGFNPGFDASSCGQ